MEEPVPVIQTPDKGRKGITTKRVVVAIVVIMGCYLAYSVADIFLSPAMNVRQICLIPEDAAIIIETTDPIGDWNKFSRSGPWQSLQQAEAFAEAAANVEMLDSVMRENRKLLSFVGKRDMIISLHRTKVSDWDFLIVADLRKASRMNMLKKQIGQIYRIAGFTVTTRQYKGVNITEARDPETKDILFSAFVDNHFIASYASRLVEASIDEKENPRIGLHPAFLDAEKLVSGKGLGRVYINYKALPQFLSVYMDKNQYVDMFSKSMDYAGLYLAADNDKMEVAGYTFMNENPDPYVAAILRSGKHKMKAHEIMPARTALYTNVGFANHVTFIRELEQALRDKDVKTFDAYKTTREKLEKYFDISLEENFLKWMSGEFALAMAEPGLPGREPELILAIRAANIRDARKNMDFLEERIRRRTPIQVKTVVFDEYEIKYIEMKGFFRLFFGGLLDEFEKPYYTYLDNFVVFSNKPSSLLSFLADYKQKNLLNEDPAFRKSLKQVKDNSSLFIYADMPRFYYLLPPLLSPDTWVAFGKDRNVLFSFPQWSLQVVGEKHNTSLQFTLNHNPWEEPDLIAEAANLPPDEETTEDDNQTDREIMSELQRFYVEKFQGNVLRDFYPEGSLKSETEMKDGKRNGRHREFYESGKLKVRGRYTNNKPKGTWKYYTEESRLDRKEKH